jgi:hypothetical protein
VLKGTLDAKTVTERPAKMPIGIDWPEEIYKTPELMWSVMIDGQEYMLSEVQLELVNPSAAGSLRLAIASESERAELELELFEEEFVGERIPNYRS